MEAANSTTESNRSLAAGLVQRLEGLTKAPPSQPNERPFDVEILLKSACARYGLELADLNIRRSFSTPRGTRFSIIRSASNLRSSLRITGICLQVQPQWCTRR